MILRFLLAALAAFVIAAPARAEDTDEAKRDALIASEWFKKGAWTSELAKAQAEAKKTGKLILVYYTVTDRESPYCRLLEKVLLSDDRFLEWSKKFVCYCQITFSKKSTLDELTHARGRAWPWFAFLDSTGALLLPVQPTQVFKAFDEAGERVLAYVELGRRAQNGGQAEKRDLVIGALDLGRITIDDARARLAQLGELSDPQKKALAQAEANAFISDLAMKTDTSDTPAHLATGRKFLEHKKSGKPMPTSRGDVKAFWIAIMAVAVEDKNAALYEEALRDMKKRFGDEVPSQKFFESCEKTLEDMKKK